MESKKTDNKEVNVSKEEETVSKDKTNKTDKGNNKKEKTFEESSDIEAKDKEISDLKDKYLRLAAEFDNYRKRVLKEKADLIMGGGEKVILSILPVIDDFERAIHNIEKTDDLKILKEGVELIYNKLLKALVSNGLKLIDTKEAPFNTDLHEAVAMIPTQKEELKGKVVDCIQKGYKLNDKVIRHAKVAVGQ